jgi:hypothetical protein
MNCRTTTVPLRGAALGLALGLLFSANAQAQSNSTGNIAGHATAGDVVIVTNPKNNFTREVTVGENGRYRIGSLPLATYVVTVQHADGTVYLTQPTRVQMGLTSNIKQQD